MKIVADENIPLLQDFFGGLGDIVTYPGRSINTNCIRDADILLVRSVTRVNQALLHDAAIRFVGTCTIGTDHIDEAYLHKRGIGFASAPGCNADSVVDYVLSALAALALKYDFSLFERKIGIVGIGNVGGRLKHRLEALGIGCLCNDPPLQEQGMPGLVDIATLIEETDVISLHAPLVTGIRHPSFHLFDADRIRALKPGCILLNTGRGELIDNEALANSLKEGRSIKTVLDVWEKEPEISPALLAATDIATPHIAGYSRAGKIRGTAMVYEAVCRHFGLATDVNLNSLLPKSGVVAIQKTDLEPEKVFYSTLLACYDVREDDRTFKGGFRQTGQNLAQSFDRLRKDYPQRNEFSSCRISAETLTDKRLLQWLTAAGIGTQIKN